MRLHRRVLVAALVLVAGCDVFGPGRGGTGYALRTVDGVSLPATVSDNASGRMVAVADTIILRDDGTGLRISVADWYDRGVNEPDRIRQRYKFTWTLSGSEFAADFACNDTGACIIGPHFAGSLDGDELALAFDLFRAVPAVYERAAVAPYI